MLKLITGIFSLMLLASIAGCDDHGHDHDENGGHPHDAPKHHDSLK